MLCVKSRVTFLLSNEILFPFHTVLGVLLPRKHHILQKYSEHADCTLCKYNSNQINLYWAYTKISQIIRIQKERRSQFYRNVLKLYCYNCPSNIYTLSDEVIAAVFAINSSASTAARIKMLILTGS